MTTTSGSRIFESFRALGLHSSDVGHATRFHRKQKEFYVFTAVGKVFHTYNCSKLGLCQVSNSHPSDIECIAADDIHVFTSCQKIVYAFKQGRWIERTYIGHDDGVHLILPFGKHLLTVDHASNVIVWHIATGEQYLSLQFSKSTFDITTVLHPSTYVNKVLFGSRQGKMQLWNISKNKLIYEFLNLKESPITVLEQAPALDVLGIGTECGEITLLNLRTDEVIMQLKQECSEITAITFRTDGETIMAVGTIIGHVYLWDLDSRKLKGKMENVHLSAVAGATFLPGKSILITNSGDNSLVEWQFDKGTGVGTQLRIRSGHCNSQTKIRFYQDTKILSAANDSTLRIFSCLHASQDKSLGHASLNRKQARHRSFKLDDGKLPPIVDFALETAREGQWDGVLAAHYRHPVATTWNLRCERMGSHKFVRGDEKFKKSDNRTVSSGGSTLYVSSVACTACGNFCLIGYNKGFVDLYNIQSGLHRGSYVDKSLRNNKAHRMSVKAVMVDALNQLTITAGSEGCVKFWRFKQKTLLTNIEVVSLPAFASLHRGTSLLAVALDDYSLTIIDSETRKIVRHFTGHSGKLNDLCWSDDGRWVITSSMDCCVKTWDLPSVVMLDCFMVDSAVSSIALSPSTDLLATTHVDEVGVYLWSNRTLYGHVNLTPLPQDYHPEHVIDLPTTIAPTSADEEVEIEESPMLFDDLTVDQEEVGQLDHELITLSNLPYAKWANVLHLDNIRLRNKPKEPPKAPKSAPFFLPTVSGLNPHFLVEEEKNDPESKLIQTNPTQQLSEFAAMLLQSEDDYQTVLTALKSMSMLAIDTEIRALSPDSGGSIGLLEVFLEFIEHGIDSKLDFEIVQAYFSLFLSVHTETLATIPNMEDKLSRINAKLDKDRLELSNLLNQTQCIVNYIKSATL